MMLYYADGGVEMEPETAEGTDISEGEAQVVAECTYIAKVATASGNVKNLIKKFEFVEKPGTDALVDNAFGGANAVRYNGLDGSQKSPHVDQPGVGVVGQLVKRFDGSDKVYARFYILMSSSLKIVVKYKCNICTRYYTYYKIKCR